MLHLKEALTKPEQVAIVKCSAHQSGTSKVILAATNVAGYKTKTEPKSQLLQASVAAQDTGLMEIIDMQTAAAPNEKQAWVEKGALGDKANGVWTHMTGDMILTSCLGLFNSCLE